MPIRKLTVFGTLLLLASSVFALADNCTVDTFPYSEEAVTKGWAKVAQMLQPPPSCNKLVSFQFELAARDSAGSVGFSIYRWEGGPTGRVLYQTILPWNTTDSVIVVDNINVVLDPNDTYVAVINLLGYTRASVFFQYNNIGYPRGDATWGRVHEGWYPYPDTNLRFRAAWDKP